MENTQKEKMVQVPESQLNTLLDRIDKLEKGQGQLIKPKRVMEHVARLREWDGKLVVGFTKVYQVLNQATQSMDEKIELILKDGNNKQKVEAGYLDFLNNALPINVKILEQRAEKKEDIVGRSNLVDPKDDRIYPDKTIDMIVTSVDYTSKVEVLDGQFKGETFVIENRFLNM